jgi:P pilus assembly chaperone PapD
MKKSLILCAVLSLSSLCFAGQKSYGVTLSAPVTISGVKLQAGDYKIKMDGANAVFTDKKSQKVNVPAKITTGAKKVQYTIINTSKSDGVDKVKAIDIGGSTTRIEFAE